MHSWYNKHTKLDTPAVLLLCTAGTISTQNLTPLLYMFVPFMPWCNSSSSLFSCLTNNNSVKLQLYNNTSLQKWSRFNSFRVYKTAKDLLQFFFNNTPFIVFFLSFSCTWGKYIFVHGVPSFVFTWWILKILFVQHILSFGAFLVYS